MLDDPTKIFSLIRKAGSDKMKPNRDTFKDTIRTSSSQMPSAQVQDGEAAT